MKLTEKRAYLAMFYFLDMVWHQASWIQLGDLLGGVHLLSDGTAADPAYWEDWKVAVDKAIRTDIPGED